MPLLFSSVLLLATLCVSTTAAYFCRDFVCTFYKDAALLPYFTRILYAYNIPLHSIPLLYYAVVLRDAVNKNLRPQMLYHAVNILSMSVLVLLLSLVVNALPFIKLLIRI